MTRLLHVSPLLGALALCAAANPAHAAADLVVTSIVLDPAAAGAGDGTVRATLKNIGDAEANPALLNQIDVGFYRDGVWCDESNVSSLDAGEETVESAGGCNPDVPGTYAITVVVDAGDPQPDTWPGPVAGDVDESDESNNALTTSITWTGPDLVVTDIALSPSPAKYGDGTITATIKNQGPVGTDTFLNIDVDFFRDGVKCADGILIAGLGAGSVATEQTGACNPALPGTHTIEVKVDSTFEVPETNESNNTASKSLSWLAPDLVITDVVLQPDPAKAGEGTLVATIQNVGAIDTADLLNIDIEMFLDGVPCDTGIVIAGLNAGSTATEETGDCNPASGGPHTVTFVVDSTEEVIETNELNNVWEGELTWHLPDLVVKDIVFEGDQLLPGKSNQFTATIANVGVVDTQTFVNIDIEMRLDGEVCDDGVVIAGLGAGKEAQESTTKCNPATPGEHVLTFEVDVTGEVQEGDEANNTLSKTFVFCGDAELCNGADDDCDGETDEDWQELGAACDGPDEDVCETGSWACKANGNGVECQETGGSGELCNGQDDDCDGQTDEDWPLLGAACDGPDADDCAAGAWACRADGGGVECAGDGAGGTESCDGIDNDCDGQTDEGFDVGAACTVTSGGCAASGATVCKADGTGTECEASAGGGAETCNGQDDDCDGATDEAFPEVGAGCVAGTGLCQVIGQYACAPGGQDVTCDAAPGAPAGQEFCGNFVDDDCDGATDEGCGCSPGGFVPCGSNVGECVSGVQGCGADGTLVGTCAAAVGPADETCDGKDNDCDGSVDEGCTCTEGAQRDCAPESGLCKAGKQACSDGVWGACEGAQLFQPEACDAKDNDCDGETDEGCPCSPGDTRLCADPPNACALYERICGPSGSWSACRAVPGTEQPGCEPVGPGPGEDTGGGQPDAGGGEPDAGGGADVPGVLFDVPGEDTTKKSTSDGCVGGRAGAPWWLAALALLVFRRRVPGVRHRR